MIMSDLNLAVHWCAFRQEKYITKKQILINLIEIIHKNLLIIHNLDKLPLSLDLCEWMKEH